MQRNKSIRILAAAIFLVSLICPVAEAQRRRRSPEPKPAPPVIAPPREDANLPVQEIWVQIYGATVYAMSQDVRDPNVLYATTPRGVFRTTSAGFSWSPVPSFEFVKDLEWAAFAQSKSSPNVMYAGYHKYREDGVFVRSEDGGATWKDASGGIIGGERRVFQILIAPDNPSTVYVTCQDGAWGRKIYRTLNAGKSWTELEPDYSELNISPDNPPKLVMNPHDPAHLISHSGTLESRDGGLTWNKVKLNIQLDPSHRIFITSRRAEGFDSFFFHPNNSNLRFGIHRAPVAAGGGSILISEDGGNTWRDISIDIYLRTEMQTDVLGRRLGNRDLYQRLDAYGLQFSPVSDQIIYALTRQGVYVSNDRGKAWKQIFEKDVYSFAVIDSRTVYAVATGEVLKSSDGGANWHPSSLGLPQTTVRILPLERREDRLSWIDDASNTIYVSSYGGYWTTGNNGFIWTWVPVGEGVHVQKILVAENNKILIIVREPQVGGISLWQSDGQAGFKKLARADSGLAISTKNPQIVYADNTISEDGGLSWRKLGINITTPVIEISPVSEKVVYIYEPSGAAYVTTDGGATWRKSEPTHSFYDRKFSAGKLKADPLRATTIYYIDEAKVDRSQDAGITWEAIIERQNLGDGDLAIIYDFVVSPSNPNIMYLATKGGVLRSVNGGRAWAPYDNGINFDSIFELFATKNVVVARGVYGVYRLSDRNMSWAVSNWERYEKARGAMNNPVP